MTMTLLVDIIMAAALLSHNCGVESLQVSMVGSSMRATRIPLRITPPPPPPSPVPAPFDLSSGLVSQLAVTAIKARLRDETGVACEVTASSSELVMRGKVGPVTVRGRGWKSGLGLTCRAIEATVDACELDTARVFTNRKLVLKRPALGTAMIALDSTDFGNFLAHPLVRPPIISSSDSLHFLRDRVIIDPSSGTVEFVAEFNDEEYSCALQRNPGSEQRAIVQVSPRSDEMELQSRSHMLGELLTKYFNEIVFEVDGTFLMFRDMMVTDKGVAPSVMLSMQIKVRKFPSRSLAF